MNIKSERKIKGTILCLTFNNFPYKDAGSIRLMAFAKALTCAGYRIKVISMGKTVTAKWQQAETGIFHKSVRSTSNSRIALLKSYLRFNAFVDDEIVKITDLKAIFLFNTTFYAFYNKKLKIARVPLIYDSTEWYNACEFRQGIFSLEYISNMIIVKHIIKKPWKVIAISCLLEEHYRKKGVVVKRIPAIMDVNAFPKIQYAPNEIIKVVYAGSPGKKDALYMIVEGVKALLQEVRNKFEFKIIGITKEEFIIQNIIKEIPENVVFLGKRSREQVISELASADFTTFMRDDKLRFVNAGFPSKLVESMAMGVPVITNLTSDLKFYLKSGENSILVDKFSSEAYARALNAVAILGKDKLVEMHRKAKQTAYKCFDYSNYIEEIEDLIMERDGMDGAYNY